ncbi:MAG: hypothetical protein K2O38_01195 [Muribaculaceae bacterium]|nr:hypothetical protein [Muribaculaceae bacterium]MDE7110500.1 hypothetical protein [Muribaculaceae bacterium]
MKQQKLKLTSSEMKRELASVASSADATCKDGTKLNCPSGTSYAGLVVGNDPGTPIALICHSGAEYIRLDCPTSGADNPVDACDGKDSGSDCSWLENGIRKTGTCQYSNSQVLYCKKG